MASRDPRPEVAQEKARQLGPGREVCFLFDVSRSAYPHDAVIHDEAVFEGQLSATNES